MIRYFRRLYENYLLKHHPIAEEDWHAVVRQCPLVGQLDSQQLYRLRVLTTRFLYKKHFSGGNGFALDTRMKAIIAAHACLLILELDFSWFDGWVEVVVYPDVFRVVHEQYEDSGVVTRKSRVLSGESWGRGPLVLSWTDVAEDVYDRRPGSQVILHEFAHKLDMRNGRTNGMPPLHRGMDRKRWTEIFTGAFDLLRLRIEQGYPVLINTYGASAPAEFFAVMTEYFFTEPTMLSQRYPNVYGQLVLFYRLDPLYWQNDHLPVD